LLNAFDRPGVPRPSMVTTMKPSSARLARERGFIVTTASR